MTDQPSPSTEQPGCAKSLLVVIVVVLVLAGVLAMWNAVTGSDDPPRDAAIAQLDDAYGDCLATIGLSVDDATVEPIPESAGFGAGASRVILADDARFAVHPDAGVQPLTDQATIDLEEAGC